MEKCGNENCSNILDNNSQIYECSDCSKMCCSEKCLLNHTKNHLSNQNNNNNRNVSQKIRSSFSQSIFIKLGSINSALNNMNDPKFILINFDINKNNKLGKGDYSDIYFAKNTKDNKDYAIKHIKKNLINPDKIYKEIEIHLTLNHPNILKLYDYKEDNNNFFLILDLCKMNLKTYIKNNIIKNENDIFNIFIQILDGIHFLHINNYSHNLIRSENILIKNINDLDNNMNSNNFNNVLLCDFKKLNKIEENNENNQIYDLWCLGIVLYEMIYKKLPFKENDDYYEYFNNGLNINDLIDNNNNSISEECLNLVKKLLMLNKNSEIKSKEIFSYGWINKFEKLYKKIKIQKTLQEKNNYINEYKSFDLNINKNEFKQPVINNDNDNIFQNALKKVNTKKKKYTINNNKNEQNYLKTSISNNNNNFEENDDNNFKLLKDSIQIANQNKDLYKINENKNLIENNNNEHNNNNNNINKESDDDDDDNNYPYNFTTHKKLKLKKPPKNKKNQNDNNIVNVPKIDEKNFQKNNNEKLFIDEMNTPTPYSSKTENLNLDNAIGLLQNANKLKENNEKVDKKNPEKVHKEPSFWDRILAPFKCGDEKK